VPEALQGAAPSRSSVEEQMAWAKERKTTPEEDIVYSLFGVFNGHMPPVYGEGAERALESLQKEIRESSGDVAAILPKNAKTNSFTQDARLSKIHQWLSAPGTSLNHQKALK
jgi:hypothetical protein